MSGGSMHRRQVLRYGWASTALPLHMKYGSVPVGVEHPELDPALNGAL